MYSPTRRRGIASPLSRCPISDSIAFLAALAVCSSLSLDRARWGEKMPDVMQGSVAFRASRLSRFTILACCSAWQMAAFATQTFTVTNINDSGPGSLRQAMIDANAACAHAGVVSGSCAIDVAADGTIPLSSDLPLIFNNLRIDGPPGGVTVDGQGAYR